MAYLFDRLDVIGSEFVELWNNTWADQGQAPEVATCHLIDLPAHQHGELESDFLGSHLPFQIGGFSGRYPNGDPWLCVLQVAPAGLAAEHLNSADPHWVLRRSLERALAFNPEASLAEEIAWTGEDLLQVYADNGSPTRLIETWPLADLLRGLLGECCGVTLARIATLYPGCPFPGIDHSCEGDTFTDIYVASMEGRVPQGLDKFDMNTIPSGPSRRPAKKAQSGKKGKAKKKKGKGPGGE